MTMTDARLTNAFLEYSRIKLVDEYWPRLRHCVESISEEQGRARTAVTGALTGHSARQIVKLPG